MPERAAPALNSAGRVLAGFAFGCLCYCSVFWLVKGLPKWFWVRDVESLMPFLVAGGAWLGWALSSSVRDKRSFSVWAGAMVLGYLPFLLYALSFRDLRFLLNPAYGPVGVAGYAAVILGVIIALDRRRPLG